MLAQEEIKNLFQIFKSGSLENIEIAIQIAESSGIDLYLEDFEALHAYLVQNKIFKVDENTSITKKVFDILNLTKLKLRIIEEENAILPANIYLLKNLQTLIIEAPINIWVPNTLNYFEQLEALELQLYNQTKLPNCIFDIKTLKRLDLSMNLFQELPRDIWKLRNLEELNLCYCLNLEKISNELFGLPHLETVYLFHTLVDEISPSIVYSNITKYIVDFEGAKSLMANPEFAKKLLLSSSHSSKFGQLFKEKLGSYKNNKIKNVPQNIINQGTDAVKEYLKRK